MRVIVSSRQSYVLSPQCLARHRHSDVLSSLSPRQAVLFANPKPQLSRQSRELGVCCVSQRSESTASQQGERCAQLLDTILKGDANSSTVTGLLEQMEVGERPAATDVVADQAATALAAGSSEVANEEALWWEWDYGSRIHYTKRGQHTDGPRILLLHGFGVGGFHFEELMTLLAKEHQVWAMDLLGQGLSWPQRDPIPGEKLQYSVDTWTRQVHDFVLSEIGQPVYLVGNSLGGFVSVCVGATHPELVKGVVLLNATPFWAFLPHPSDRASLLAKIMPWDGTVPAPAWLVGTIRRLWWDHLRSPATLQALLAFVYHNREAADERLVQRIAAATQHERALDAFASIMFSPKAPLPFDAMLEALRCGVCMIYGREDPWVVPLWGQRLKRVKPDATYFEVSPSGHCPHHEAAEAVFKSLSAWVASQEGTTGTCPLAVGESWNVQAESVSGKPACSWTVTHVDGQPRNIFEKVDATIFSMGQWLAKLVHWRSVEQASNISG